MTFEDWLDTYDPMYDLPYWARDGMRDAWHAAENQSKDSVPIEEESREAFEKLCADYSHRPFHYATWQAAVKWMSERK